TARSSASMSSSEPTRVASTAPTSLTGGAWRRSAQSGASSTAPRWGDRRNGRTRPKGVRRDRRTNGGGGTTAMKVTREKDECFSLQRGSPRRGAARRSFVSECLLPCRHGSHEAGARGVQRRVLRRAVLTRWHGRN